MTDKVFNIFINSAYRSPQDRAYDFTIFFNSDEIIIKPDESVNVNVASFSMLNSMYNVNQHTGNNMLQVYVDGEKEKTIFIPYGNYDVYTLNLIGKYYYNIKNDDLMVKYYLKGVP
jgi:hypothetical protein